MMESLASNPGAAAATSIPANIISMLSATTAAIGAEAAAAYNNNSTAMMDMTGFNSNFSSSSTSSSFAAEDNSSGGYVYERLDVQAIFLTIYSSVFFTCFFGNLMVILVVTLHWRMRSITNFCLANLAFADLCVAIFCIYQNLYIYFMKSWVFGAFLCKIYFFITELSHTVSILILVVICIERYLAIIHPMRCKEWLTLSRLRMTIVGVWGLSAIYSSPKLVFSDIRQFPSFDGTDEILCIPIRNLYNSELYEMFNMGFLFVLPLGIITVLYTRIGVVLWKSSRGQMTMTNSNAKAAASTTATAMPPVGIPREEIANEQSSSSSNDGEGLIKKHQITCLEILCCGCASKCCKSCKTLKKKTHFSLPSTAHQQQQQQQQQKLTNENYENTDSLHNYYCPSSNQSSGVVGAPHNGIEMITMNNSSSAKQPHCGILKSNPSLANHHPHHSSSSSTSSSSSSSTANSNTIEPKISSTEPIVVVRFDSSIEKGKKNGGGLGGRSARAHCTILLKSPENSENSALADKCNGNLEIPLLENGPGEGLEPNLTASNESPIISTTRQNNVMWVDKLVDQNGNGRNSSLVQTRNLRNNVLNKNCTNGGGPTNNRIRRMRVIRSCRYGTRALKSRRRVIRMLVVIVVVFALCNLPFHARKIWQTHSSSYDGGSDFSSIFTPVTILLMYMNSAINPILYAFLSKKFRLSFWDLLTCRIGRSLRIARNASMRSTHVLPLSTAALP